MGKLNLNKKDVIETYKKLRSSPKVAKRFNCSTSTIVKILNDNDIKIYGKKLNLNERDVIKFYKKLRTAKKVSKIFGCSRRHIEKILKKNNIKMFRNKININEKKVIKIYKKLKTMEKTSKIFNCGLTKISRILSKNNIKRNKSKLNLDEKEVIRFYEKIKNLGKTAKNFNCSPPPIHKILKKNKIQIYNTHVSKYNFDEKEVVRLYTQDKKFSREISKIFGRGSVSVIFRILKRNNIKLRTQTEKWKNPEFVKKTVRNVLKKSMQRPTSYENKISELCIKYHLPFIYTGDGTFLIGRKNPDFINKEKRIAIEVFNDYHKEKIYGSVENYIKQRSEYFKERGYLTIFIRQEEVTAKNWEEICLNKIKESYNE